MRAAAAARTDTAFVVAMVTAAMLYS